MISVIVPALNEAATLAETLAVLAPWRAAGTEVIVVDGGSDDDTAVIAAVGADRVVRAPRGRARQLNAGAAAARGEVLLFLHADTHLPATALDGLANVFRAGNAWGFFALSISGRHPLLPVIARLASLRSRVTGIATGDQAIFVSRELFESVGGFPDIALMEDIALSRRLRDRTRPVALRLKATTSGRRWEQNGVVRTIFLMWRLRLAYAFGVSPAKLARRYAGMRERERAAAP